MNYLKNNTQQKQTCRKKLSQSSSWQSVACRDIQEMLELLSNTEDLDILVKCFSTLSMCLLTKFQKREQNHRHCFIDCQNITYDRAIKCNALYEKLDLVLRSGLQSKIIIALNFISILLHLDNENELTKNKSLHIFAKNMIRISGCLTAMTELFTSFMMQQDTWKALCRSISETCHGSVSNQAFCSHLVPLCIQRCKRGNMDPISVLQSLLLNHERNVTLFYESNGMTIFDRESLQSPACLQLLNLVVENTKPEHRDEILKASDLFRQLRSYLNKYGRNSMVGQWATIILFSLSKVIQTNIINEEGDEDKNNKTLYNSINETKKVNETFNETSELLGNVLREAIGWQNQLASKTKFRHNIFNGNYKDNIPKKRADMLYLYANPRNGNETAEHQENDIFRFAVATETADLSFSFLLKENPEPRFKKPNYMLKFDQHPAEQVETSYDEPSYYHPYKHRTFKNSTRNRKDKTVLEFKPPFASTPKSSKHSNLKTTSRTSQESLKGPTTRDHTICNKTIKSRNKFTNTTLPNKRLHNKSMSAKFLDTLNRSCKKFIEGFKRMFTIEETSYDFDDKSKCLGITNVEENNSCVFSTTIHQRDAPVSREKKGQNWTNYTKEFSLENSYFNSCDTCNDTFVLKHKFENDAFLQQTVKKLKLGINLYGCDFKVIFYYE